MTESDLDRTRLTARDFDELFESVRTWGTWGDQDERGALHYLTAARVAAAAGHIRDGVTVGLGAPLNTVKAADNPQPADHHMTMLADTDVGSGSLRFAKDFVGVDYHADTHSHLDALCHVAYRGSVYNDRDVIDSITPRGATVGAIQVLKHGLVGRGVLLDVPGVRGVPWLEPGEHVFREDLEAAEDSQGIRVQDGDILLVRTGHARRLADLGPWNREMSRTLRCSVVHGKSEQLATYSSPKRNPSRQDA